MELISLHIPKTGGTAFKTLLQSVYGAEELLFDYEDQIGRPDSRFRTDFDGWRRDNEQHIREITPGTRAVHGHFWAGKYLPYFPEARKILWLRDPARLLISAYFYWKRRPPKRHPVYEVITEKNMSPLQFAALPDVQNPVTSRFLKGYDIGDFDFIGIMEHFAEDVEDLCEWMRWPKIEVPVVNKTVRADYAQFEFDEAVDQIRAYNSSDVVFYNAALERRRERRARAPW
jgi:hypothetical protein